MLPQQAMIARLRQICQDDSHLLAAMLYGSFTRGEADQFSDIDVMLFFQDDALAGLDQTAWINQIAPVELYYHNEFGNGVAIFDNLVRAELHFDPASDMPKLEQWRGTVWFPSPADTVLVDKTGRLARHLEPLLGPAPTHNSAEDARFINQSFLNWFLFGVNVCARGEDARALEILRIVQDYLLRMARMLEGRTEHWITPTRAAERELSPAAYERFRACAAALDRPAIERAYGAAWRWGSEMMAALAARYGVELATGLMTKIERLVRNFSPG